MSYEKRLSAAACLLASNSLIISRWASWDCSRKDIKSFDIGVVFFLDLDDLYGLSALLFSYFC
jgi:hypothetical protein